MIAKTQDLLTKVSELKTLIEQLDGKDIMINVTGNANAQLDQIASKVEALDGKNILINVVYRSVGDPNAVAAAEQTVKRVFVGSENLAPIIQPVIDKNISTGDTAALKAQFQSVIGNAGSTAAAVGATNELSDAQKNLQASTIDVTDALGKQMVAVNAASNAVRVLKDTDQLLIDAQAVIDGDLSQSSRIFGNFMAAAGGGGGGGPTVGVLAGWWAQWGTVVHWVVAGFAEWAAVAIPGMVAMASAALVAAQAATNVYERLSAMYTVQEALGPATNQTIGSMLGLGSSFQKAQNAMQPQLYEIYGAAIDALKGKGSELASMGEQIVNTFSTFAAKVDVELKNGFGSELQGLVSKGAQDFTEFGQILGNIGHAIVNFAAAMPGLAEVLLKILDVLSEFLKIISEIPAPIITAAMAFEEFLRWGSLVNGMIAGLTGVFSKFAEALGAEKVASSLSSIQMGMKGLTEAEDGSVVATNASMTTFGGFFSRIVSFVAENPFAALAVVIAIAMGAATIYFDKAKSGMDQWISSVNQAVTAAPDFAQVNTTVRALSATTTQLSGAQDVLNTKTSAWSALASGAQENVTALKNAQQDYIGDINTESQNVGVLAEKLGVSVPTAIAIANGAGVKLTDTLQGNSNAAQVNWQKIQNLITGYQALGQQGNQLAADMNVVSITASGQLSNVQKLNTAWQNFIALGVGAQSDFIAFQQGLATISTDAAAAGASFDGLNANSLTLRSSFETNITNMTKSLGDMNTALSFGGVSWNQYRQAIATMIQEMLAAGNISGAQAAQLGAIASAAGYTGNSYSSLTGWAGKYAGSQSQLNTIMDQATIALSNQKTMLQQIQGSMQQDVISTTAQAVLQQGGFQQALTKTYDAFKSGGASSAQFKSDLSDLDGILKSAGMNQQQINQYNEALTKSWQTAGDSAQSAAGKTGALNNAFDTNKVAADGLRDQIKNVFIAIGHDIEHYADDAGSGLVSAWNGTVSVAKGIWSGLETNMKSTWDTISNDARVAWDAVKSVAESIWGGIVSWVEGLGNQFMGWWSTHGDEIKQVWNQTWGDVKNIASTLWTATVDVLQGGFNTMKSIFDSVTGVLRVDWSSFWNLLVTDVKGAWAIIGPIVTTGWDVVKNVFDMAMAGVKAAWDIFWNAVIEILKTAWDAVETILKVGWDLVVGMFSVFLDLITGHWSQAWTDMKAMLTQIWNAMSSFLNSVWNNLKAMFSSDLNIIEGFWESVWNHIVNITHSVWNGLLGFFKGIWSNITSGFSGAVNGIKRVWDTLSGIFDGPVNFLIHTVYDNGIARLWNDVAGAIGIPKLPLLAEGGKITQGSGPKSDDVLARVSKGETVVSAEHSQALAGLFGAIGVPGYAGGGIPNPIGSIVNAAKDVASGVEHFFTNPLGTITDIASVVAALATGNTTALGNDFKKFLGNSGGATGELASMIIGIPRTLISDAMNFITGKAAAKAAAAAATLHPTGSGGSVEALMKSMAASVGWTGQEWNALYSVEMAEAGFDLTAKNPSSGAYGLAQFINGPGEYAQYGGNVNTAAGQITAMLNYIAQRYGSPDAAWAHESAYHWYDNGGYLMPGLTMAYNGTGVPERVSPPGGDGGMMHTEVHLDGNKLVDAIVPYMYRKANRNRGNGNSGQYWTP